MVTEKTHPHTWNITPKVSGSFFRNKRLTILRNIHLKIQFRFSQRNYDNGVTKNLSLFLCNHWGTSCEKIITATKLHFPLIKPVCRRALPLLSGKYTRPQAAAHRGKYRPNLHQYHGSQIP